MIQFRQRCLIFLFIALAELFSQIHLEAVPTFPNDAYVTNVFDSLNRVVDIYLKNSRHYVLSHHGYQYDAGNQCTKHTRTAGDYIDYTYDNIGQLQTAVGKEAGGTSRLREQFGYAYDAAHNLQSRTNNALLLSFALDERNQITARYTSGTLTVAGATSAPATNVTVNGSSATLYSDNTFAKSGLWLSDGNNTFTAIAQDPLGQADTNSVTAHLPASNASYAYGGAGNLEAEGSTSELGRRTYGYDPENRLISMQWVITPTPSLTTGYADFLSDPFGRLVRRTETVGGTTTERRYVYTGRLVLQERDGSNVPKVTYTRGLDLSGSIEGAGGIGGMLARTDNTTGAPAYYHSDGNGNVTMLLNTAQVPVAKYAYDPFGNTLAMSGPLAEANTYRFSSKEINTASGLYNFGERWYNPNLQRWLNHDPTGMVDGPNLYAYLGNGSVNGIDPWGEMKWLDEIFDAGFTVWGWIMPSEKTREAYGTQGHWIEINQEYYVNNLENFQNGHIPSALSIAIPSQYNDAFREGLNALQSLDPGHEEFEAITPYLAMIPGLQPVAAAVSAANAGLYAAEGNSGRAALNFGLAVASGIGAASTVSTTTATTTSTTTARVFWSGSREARLAAESFAKASGAQTLEMTFLGQALDSITTRITYPFLKPVWNMASRNFARGANGPVNVFQSASRGVRVDSTWGLVEYPVLKSRGNPITYHIAP